MSDFVDSDPDRVNGVLDFLHRHVKQLLGIIAHCLDLLPVLILHIVVIIVISRVLDLDLKPDSFIAPPGPSVVQADPVVSVLLQFFIETEQQQILVEIFIILFALLSLFGHFLVVQGLEAEQDKTLVILAKCFPIV